MFQLVLGVAGTGKTAHIYSALQRRAAQGKYSILLVPEQFSSTAEGVSYQKLGDAYSAFVQVLSFRTLAQRILRDCGGIVLPVLDDAGRAVYVRRALDRVGEKLSAFARQRRSAAFCNLCAQTLGELKTAGATPQKLREIARDSEDDKLLELALIFEAYEEEIAGSAMDPEDRLLVAARRAQDGYFDELALFIDSFDGFTAPEYALLQAALPACEEATVALCCDGLAERDGGMGLFSPVRRVAQRLLDTAKKAGLTPAPVQLLQKPLRAQSEGVAAAAALLCGQAVPAGAAAGLYITPAADEWEEVRAAASEMRRLALSGVPYGKMALVCRDMQQYAAVVRRQFELYDIPFFADTSGTIEYTAPVVFLRAALGLLVRGITSQGVLALVKSGLCGYTEEEIAALENYVYTWQPKAADWKTTFQQNPEGRFASMDKMAEQQLQAAERLRSEVAPAVQKFVAAAKGKDARALSRQLYLLMRQFGAEKHLEALAQSLEAAGDVVFAQQTRRAYDMAMEMLDAMAQLLGGDVVSPGDYDELFLVLVRSASFGQVPQTLECALFTSADRMRLAEPDYCFVVGICEGEFPMQVGYSGLLNHNDRDVLVAGGIEMPGSFANRVLLEDMFFYRALVAPRKGLYLSWPRRRMGEAKTMAAALAPLCEVLAPPALQPKVEALAATPAAAYDVLGGVWRDNSALAASLAAAVEAADDGTMRDALGLLQDVDNLGVFRVDNAQAIGRIVGEEMQLSPTVAEQYYRCRFAYYMERVLRVKPRQRVELSPVESGTFVHHVLEQVLLAAGANFARLEDGEIAEMANRSADEFIEEYLQDGTQRTAQKLHQIKAVVVQLLCFMRDAAAQSGFSIDAVELEIGGGEGGVPPLEVVCSDGRRVRVAGKVDRLDVFKKDGKTYLCIIDYKTGDKKMSLDEVYCGLNMQMLIYMQALCRPENGRYQNAVPAGVLYLSADPKPASGRRDEQQEPPFAMNGLLLLDEDVLHALDGEGSGVYAPVRYKKDGGVRAAKNIVDAETFQGIQAHVQGLLQQMAGGVYGGQFDAVPAVKGAQRPCSYCAYRGVCRHEDGQNERAVEMPDDAFAPMERGGGAG